MRAQPARVTAAPSAPAAPRSNGTTRPDVTRPVLVSASDHSPPTVDHERVAIPSHQTSDASLPTVAAGDRVDGLTVLAEIPNQESIAASLDSYEVLGLRRVPMQVFAQPTPPGAQLDARTQELADAIRQNRTITPLIVVYDGHEDGPYVLEGGHRFDALGALGISEFPALVVVDLDQT